MADHDVDNIVDRLNECVKAAGIAASSAPASSAPGTASQLASHTSLGDRPGAATERLDHAAAAAVTAGFDVFDEKTVSKLRSVKDGGRHAFGSGTMRKLYIGFVNSRYDGYFRRVPYPSAVTRQGKGRQGVETARTDDETAGSSGPEAP